MGSNLIGSIGWGISALITFIIVIWLIRVYLKGKEKTLTYFIGFLGFRFFLFFSIALAPVVYALTKNLVGAGLCITGLFVSIFISLLFPPLLFSSFQWPRLKNYYFGLVLILSLAGIIIAGINFSPAIYFPETKMVFQPIPDILAKTLYPLTKILSVLPLAILFLIYAIKFTGRMKIRSLLMGLGFLWVVTTIIVPTLIPIPWAGMYCCIGDILIFAGVMVRMPEPERVPKVE